MKAPVSIKRILQQVLLITLLTNVSIVYSQENKWMIYPSLGIDMGGAVPFPFSDIPDGAKGTPKLSPNVGLGFSRGINEKWRVQIEVNYRILGFSAWADVRSQPFYFDNQVDVIYFTGETKTDVELRFVEIPLVFNYHAGNNWGLLVGPYYSRILEGTFNTAGVNGVISPDKNITDNAQLPGVANTNYNFNDELDKFDAGIFIGYIHRASSRIGFRGRLFIGFKSIFIKEFDNIDYELYQVRLDAGVTYTLFSSK
ncbi:outer membrane beta-barrel protein [Bacteroidota bacterium]